MKEQFNLWLTRNARLPGVAAACLFYPDRSRFAQSWSPQLPADTLENAWRCVADTFLVLQLNRFPTQSIRWVFANAFLYCSRRADGMGLAVLVLKEPAAAEPEVFAALISAFHAANPAV